MFQTSESTYNEYDDSALTDMSEDNASSPSPFCYDGHLSALDGDDADDSAIAGSADRLNGFFTDHMK